MTVAHITIDDASMTIRLLSPAAGADGSATDGSATEPVSFHVPCGMVSLRAAHFTSDPPQPEDLTNAIGEVTDHLDDARRAVPALVDAESVVVAGRAARAIATIEVGEAITTPTFELSRDAAEDVFRTLAVERASDRRHNPGLDPELVDVIVGGCCAVVAIARALHLTGVTVEMHTAVNP